MNEIIVRFLRGLRVAEYRNAFAADYGRPCLLLRKRCYAELILEFGR